MSEHTPPHESVVAFATRCFVEDIAVARVLAESGVNPSTWSRLRRHGNVPRGDTLDRLNKALDKLVAQRTAAP